MCSYTSALSFLRYFLLHFFFLFLSARFTSCNVMSSFSLYAAFSVVRSVNFRHSKTLVLHKLVLTLHIWERLNKPGRQTKQQEKLEKTRQAFTTNTNISPSLSLSLSSLFTSTFPRLFLALSCPETQSFPIIFIFWFDFELRSNILHFFSNTSFQNRFTFSFWSIPKILIKIHFRIIHHDWRG